MDRNFTLKRQFNLFYLLISLGIGLPSPLSWGGVTFAAPEKEAPLAPGEKYNESKWGQSPAQALMETAPAALARKGVQEVAVIAGDLGFFPKTVFLSRDVPVRIFVTGASKNTLCFMMDSFQVRRQIRSQKIEEITFTPHQPGKFRFYCPVNGMEGFMIVRELSN